MRLPAARRILKHFLAVVRQGGLRDLAKVGKALRGREPGIKEDCFLAELGREMRRRQPGRQRFRPACQTIVTQQDAAPLRSEEHTSELQSLMRISYAVFCLKTKKPQ